MFVDQVGLLGWKSWNFDTANLPLNFGVLEIGAYKFDSPNWWSVKNVSDSSKGFRVFLEQSWSKASLRHPGEGEDPNVK